MAKDIFHEQVKAALIKDGWSITHDPLTVKLTKRNIFIDLGAEKVIAAERKGQKIAVEIKSFLGFSPLTDFYSALGKYQFYLLALRKKFPDRKLYLAMPHESYAILTNDSLLEEFIDELDISFIIYNPNEEIITQWIK